MFKKHALSLAEGSTSGVLGPLSTFGLTDLPLFAAFALTYSMYAPRAKGPAALPVEGRVLGRLGWAGQTTGLFEPPLALEIILTISDGHTP